MNQESDRSDRTEQTPPRRRLLGDSLPETLSEHLDSPGDSAPASSEDLTVIGRLKELLGFEPSIQLRDLVTESEVSLEKGEVQGKYVIERVIGEGGMGRVYLALDRDLRRPVALKVIRDELRSSGEQLARFVEEAQITGQLEHPGIPPVHEIAIDRAGDVFFTLKLLRGRTLKEIIQDLGVGRGDARARFSRTRLLQIFLAVCNAVHFAHEKGVIHRDIKPANIMLGDYGEVQLMDWGLAKVMSRPESDDAIEEAVETVRTDQQLETIQGQVRGTLQYMAPEQAQGRRAVVDRRSDVYSLGATLYEILTLLPPKTGSSMQELLEESRLGLIIPPSARVPKLRVPPALEEICMKALEYHPEDRYVTALELAESIQVYLDGTLEAERRRTESERLLGDARRVLREHEIEKTRQQEGARQLGELEREAGHRPDHETKRRIAEMRKDVEEHQISLARKYTRAQTLLSAALAAWPENAPARLALGELYLERFLRAEREGNTTDLIFYRGLIEQVNDGGFDRVLEGNGALYIATEPDGANLSLLGYEDRDGQLVAGAEIANGSGRLELQELPMGSYLLLVERDGCEPVRYPVAIERNQTIRDRIRLWPDGTLPGGFRYIPRGNFIMYGDPNVLSTFGNRARVNVPGFAVARDPLTCGEYLEYLNSIAADDPEGAAARVPRESESAGFLWRIEDGVFRLPVPDRYPWSPDLPVFGVSFEDALAYCLWRSEREGRQYDLLREAEWEKAAKGVDGRFYSWGDVFDNEFANNLYARDGEHGVRPVGEHGQDCSPYDVRGMVGNVSDWCYFEDAGAADMVAVRGGNWAITADPCRLAVRRGTSSRYVSDRIGFRLKISLADS